jgi:hypothetical protein
MKVAWLGWWWVLALGCGETKPNADAAADAQAGATTGGAAGNAAGGVGQSAGQSPSGGAGRATAGTSNAGNGGSGPETNGSITVQGLLFQSASRSVRINPNFALASGSEFACMTTTYGPCRVNQCSHDSTDAPRQHVGPITVDSPEAGVHVVTTPDDDGHYVETENTLESFKGGESLAVTAAGGTLPAFSLSAQFPLLLIVEQPVATAAQGLAATAAHSRTEALTINWSRGAADVFFHVQATGIPPAADGTTTSATCRVESSPGTVTLEPAFLSALPAGTELWLLTSWYGISATGTAVSVASEAMTPAKDASVRILLE